MTQQYQAAVTVEPKTAGRPGNYKASVGPVPRGNKWVLHKDDSIRLTLSWKDAPEIGSVEFVDVNIGTHGQGGTITSSNGKGPGSPGPGWWGGGVATTVRHQKSGENKVDIYEIHGTKTEAVITDIEVLDTNAEDDYYFSGRVYVKDHSGNLISPPGDHGVAFDPEVVNKGSGGRKK